MDIKPGLISFVARSKRRREILEKLKDRMLSQPELKQLTGMYKTHNSRTLKELSERKFIVCKNPEDRAFRFYKITALGKRVLKEISYRYNRKV